MIKISQKEVKEILRHLAKRGQRSEINKRCEKLDIGEAIFIKKEKWTLSTRPSMYVQQSFRKSRSNKRFRGIWLSDKLGWVIIRAK